MFWGSRGFPGVRHRRQPNPLAVRFCLSFEGVGPFANPYNVDG